MGGMSWLHWLLVLAVVLLLFGRGKISELMGDFAKGIKSFKQGLKEEEQVAGETKNIDGPGEPVGAAAASVKKEEVKG